MDWNAVAPMIVIVTLILTTGGVIVLRPLTRRLADLLQLMVEQKRGLPPDHEIVQLRELVTSMETRLTLLEERQAFAEALLSSERRRAEAIAPPAGSGDSGALPPRVRGPAAG